MTNQTLLNLSQIVIAVGIIFTALGGYGAFYFQKKKDEERVTNSRPIIDLCRRGISVKKINDSVTSFDIPYCAGKNANAYNVKLRTFILLRETAELKLISNLDEEFPDNIVLSYETGKTITYTLSPFDYNKIIETYIYVKGSYTDELNYQTFLVSDLYKYSSLSNNWVQTLGEENKDVRKFLKLNKIL
ncbi:MAG TPA: hypothetical protein VD908_02775 [Cytophagales bacterium]|nr:hypothetical protein [Cytophagales bacterium]